MIINDEIRYCLKCPMCAYYESVLKKVEVKADRVLFWFHCAEGCGSNYHLWYNRKALMDSLIKYEIIKDDKDLKAILTNLFIYCYNNLQFVADKATFDVFVSDVNDNAKPKKRKWYHRMLQLGKNFKTIMCM